MVNQNINWEEKNWCSDSVLIIAQPIRVASIKFLFAMSGGKIVRNYRPKNFEAIHLKHKQEILSEYVLLQLHFVCLSTKIFYENPKLHKASKMVVWLH